MSPRSWRWARLVGGIAILGALVWHVGTGPFLDGLELVDARSLVAAVCLTALTTVCSAWRWSVVSRGLGVAVPLRPAVVAYYRSQFLNTMLPGGVLGDVERGVRHGRDVGDTVRGLRAVAWERLSGQVVQVVLAVGLLLSLPSPLPLAIVLLAAVVVGAVLAIVLLAGAELRAALLSRQQGPAIVVASTLAVAGHTLMFLVAARTAGVSASVATLVPLALIVLLAMGIPANVAGWGPREGAAAWAFGAAGLGASQGVAVAVVYGVMVLVASLPGAVVLLARAPGVLHGASHG